MSADACPLPHLKRHDCQKHRDDCAEVCACAQALAVVRRDLHDQVGSTLAGINLAIEATQRLVDADPGRASLMLSDIGCDITELTSRVRWLAATSQGRESSNAGTALHTMVARMNRVTDGAPDITLDVEPEVDSAADDLLWTAFWIVREAVTNVLKHSRAGHCAISLDVRGHRLRIRIEDDGIGMASQLRSAGDGVANMNSRAEERGGWCTVGSNAPHGVVVLACLPVARARARAVHDTERGTS